VHGFVTEIAQSRSDPRPLAEEEARKAYARADLAVDDSVAAELENWPREDLIGYIKPHLGARHVYNFDKRRSTTRT
jgi:hypothetical protein